MREQVEKMKELAKITGKDQTGMIKGHYVTAHWQGGVSMRPEAWKLYR